MIHGPTIWNIDIYGTRTSFVIAKCKNPIVIRTWPLVITCCATSVKYNHNSVKYNDKIASIKNTCYLVWISKWQRVVWQLGSIKAKKKFNCAKIEFIFLIDCTQWRCTSRLKSHDKHCHSKWRDFIKELIRVWVLLVCF